MSDIYTGGASLSGGISFLIAGIVITLIALVIGLVIGFSSNSWPTSLRWEIGISGTLFLICSIWTAYRFGVFESKSDN